MQKNAKTCRQSKGISFHHGKRHIKIFTTLADFGVKTLRRSSMEDGAESKTFRPPPAAPSRRHGLI
jgi:hypothetical protein